MKKFQAHCVRNINHRDLRIEDLHIALKYSSKVRGVWGNEYIDFCYSENLMFPMEGSCSLLGDRIPVKEYTLEDFIKILRESGANKFILLNAQPNKSDIFDSIEISTYTDYSQMITDLQKIGYVSTFPSTNILCTDPRKFTLVSKAISNTEFADVFEKYIGTSYEVDSLGTSFWSDMTKNIEKLWSSHFKVNT